MGVNISKKSVIGEGGCEGAVRNPSPSLPSPERCQWSHSRRSTYEVWLRPYFAGLVVVRGGGEIKIQVRITHSHWENRRIGGF